MLHNQELNRFCQYNQSDEIQIIKWEGHVARIKEDRNASKIRIGNLQEREFYEGQGVNRKNRYTILIILTISTIGQEMGNSYQKKN